MEAAISSQLAEVRELPGDKATRIIEAMRASMAARGIAGSTFDHVAREAGVSRGLLHYYFGTKERLLLDLREQGQEWAEIAAARGASAEALRKKLGRAIERVARELGLDAAPE